MKHTLVIGKRKLWDYNIYSLKRRNGKDYFKILERDFYQCVNCGHTDYILIHHLDHNVKNNSTDNLITLCRPCHAEIHGHTIRLNKITDEMIAELRVQGKTFQEIADYVGVSRQRIHQVVKKNTY